MEKILAEIEELQQSLTLELSNLEKDQLTLAGLEQAHLRVESLFNTIRNEGVCKSDVTALSELGLLSAETQYYTEIRTTIGQAAALEAEGRGGFMSIVVGGILAALVAVLAFVVGKLIGFIFGGTKKLDEVSKKSQENTAVRVRKGAAPILFDFEAMKAKLKTKTGYDDVIALHNLGPKYLEGDEIARLYKVAEEKLADLTDVIGNLKTDGRLQEELDKLTKGKSLSTKSEIEEFSKNLPLSDILVDLVKQTYMPIREIMYEHIVNNQAVDRNNEALDESTIMGRSQRVCNYRGTELFTQRLTERKKINFVLDPNNLNPGVEENDFKALEKELKKLSAYQKQISTKSADKDIKALGFGGGTLGSKDTNFIVRKYVNYQVVYPAQYLNVLIGKVISGLLKAHLNYKKTQTKIQSQASKVFFKGEIDNLSKVINGSKATAEQKVSLIKELKKIDGVQIEEACNIVANVISELYKADPDSKPPAKFHMSGGPTPLTMTKWLMSQIQQM